MRVLVLIQVGVASLHRRQAHVYKLDKLGKKAKVLVNVTHFRFLLFYTMANLFHGVLDKSLSNDFSFAG